jgi:hypothetical protein
MTGSAVQYVVICAFKNHCGQTQTGNVQATHNIA